ncbi:MAG: 3-hydroxybutyryl-CoA dehydrogenase [Geothrix sp.]|uniref:3-hydroxyacyl-CoA dehydrogenase family protein n=1 Tax=Geothrix sp. TaxID=1962974 RepID=UPI001811F83B|nr:3-hydroxybutyryl-CoA dehydrogenase [Geothrix sp.]NWJ39947.1 3-hydroxybutyryl-CoA dehydrogenase [Geothrix sp.]WIL22041.1 MAG: 3-hydroxybutyryl-CoA dehydrogenase [Geothrix sp.]
MDIHRVGVVGCGLMGSGIAQCAAESGCEVWVKEADEALLTRGLARVHGAWDRAVAKGKATDAQRDTWTGNLRGTLAFPDLATCDLVVEAIPERLDLKLQTFAELDRVLGASALLCTNTSSLSVAQLSPVLAPHRLPRLAGLHFFNPVPAMPLVEVIRTLATEENTLASLRTFVQQLGKTAVMAPDAPGFIVNRLLVPYLLDAMRCAEQRLASVEDIDTGMKLGCGHPMGPLHLSDFIGLDTMQSVAEVLFEAFGEPRFKAPALLRQLVASGRLGRKTGSGFYRWEGEKRQEAMPL